MSKASFTAALVALSAPLMAQTTVDLPAGFSPTNAELSGFTLVPLMQSNARVQMFYRGAQAPAAPLTATALELRFDGPIPAVGSPGPFQVQRLQLRVGTTAIAQPGAVFANNLTTPLATVFDGPATYWPDQGSQVPAPWGGLNGGLHFAFSAPLPVTVAAGEWLVVEMIVESNNILGGAHAILDGETGPGGPADGGATNSGQGCAISAGAPTATASSTGTRAPGAAHTLTAQGLQPTAPALAAIGLSDSTSSFGPLPLPLPGSNCTILGSADLVLPAFTDLGGSLIVPLPVPANPALNGVVLHEQAFAVAPGANPWNLVATDLHSVQLGAFTPPASDFYTVCHDSDAAAPVAQFASEFGYALRLIGQ